MTIEAIIVDTETTGFTTPEVIEMAWVEVTERTFERVEHIKCERYKPVGKIELGAIATHHILPSDLALCTQYTPDQLPPSTYLIGHNIDFDWEVLGKPHAKRICTLAMSRNIWPELDSHKLTAIFYHIHGLNSLTRDVVKNAHSALHDVAMTHQIFNYITEKAGLTALEDVWKFSEVARIPTHMTFGKYKGSPIADVDKGYVNWYRKQPDPDPYLLMAFTRAGK